MSKNSVFSKNVGWRFDNTYVGLPEMLMSKTRPVPVSKPELVVLNRSLALDLGLNFNKICDEDLALLFSGNRLPEGSNTISQAYAGHQFGYFTNLGDGRAVLIGEQISKNGKRFDVQLKGSGHTPYSRGGDGRAALGPAIREYVVSEAMHHLGIPTTRSLAVIKTGENVLRDAPLPGGIITRVASSHLRVGTFQYVASSGNIPNLKSLADYTIKRHFKNLERSENKYLGLIKEVIKKQVLLVAGWMRVGFIHGVMNTDNTSISGETIDYGPCAFMDDYNPRTVFSSIDAQGRYAYCNQPLIVNWNTLRFAETLIPLVNKSKDRAISLINEEFVNFENKYKEVWESVLLKKVGIKTRQVGDMGLVNNLLNILEKNKLDYTNAFFDLMLVQKNKDEDLVKNNELLAWKKLWKERVCSNNRPFADSVNIMKKYNPAVIPRNHIMEKVLKDSYSGNYSSLLNFVEVLKKPYTEPKDKKYRLPPGENERVLETFCGT